MPHRDPNASMWLAAFCVLVGAAAGPLSVLASIQVGGVGACACAGGVLVFGLWLGSRTQSAPWLVADLLIIGTSAAASAALMMFASAAPANDPLRGLETFLCWSFAAMAGIGLFFVAGLGAAVARLARRREGRH